MRKICIITGSRAEYGLLYWLIREIDSDDALKLQLIVTGSHLSPEFGLTWREIEKDGFPIDDKIETLLSSDTETGIAKSAGLGVIGFADSFSRLQPDLVVIFGDRFEMLAAAMAALTMRLPIAHIGGGQITEGAIDDAIRHAITKMAHLHFTSIEEYRKRIIQLGESPERVFATGSTGVDNIVRETLLNRSELEDTIGFKFGHQNLLATFHPATLDAEPAETQMAALLDALDGLNDVHILFTMPNADVGGRALMGMIEDFTAKRPGTTVAFTSLGRVPYLSALGQVDGVVGNSSSGIIEAPSFKIGTVNIGDRQKGRLRATSVIDCGTTTDAITKAMDVLYSETFRKSLETVANPFGDGQAAARIAEILKTFSLDGIVRKKFFDVDFTTG